MKKLSLIFCLTICSSILFAQETERAQKVRTKSNAANEKSTSFPINNSTMPNRISMNVTVGKQTITVNVIESGAVVLFPNKTGLKIDSKDQVITEMTADQYKMYYKISKESHGKQTQGTSFGEKVNAGLHATGSPNTSSERASALIHTSITFLDLGSGGGGAAAASYAKNQKSIKLPDDETDITITEPLADGEYELSFTIQQGEKGLKDTLKTQARLAFTMENNIIKTKHDTAKNSISNVR